MDKDSLGEASIGIKEDESVAQVWNKAWVTLAKQACMNWKEERVILVEVSTQQRELLTMSMQISRSPFLALEKKTPMSLWSGNPVNYKMLRIFGYVAYSYRNQGKLKPRAIKCIFIWDVVFNESLMYKDTLKGVGAEDSRKEVEEKRTNTILAMYRDKCNLSLSRLLGSREEDDMAAYAFVIVEDEDIHQPITFHEAINSSEKG
ncbi:hypothetical protein Tco_0612911 [Tanacetum coccineum]